MNRKNPQISIILTPLVIFTVGVTFINYHWNESWKLFWYDLKNGFSGFGWLYPMAFVVVGLLAAASAVVLYLFLVKRKCIKSAYNGKKMHKYTPLYIYIYNYTCIIILILCAVFHVRDIMKSKSKCIWEPTKTIGHSFGIINGDTYTGSWEAFEENYARGRRVMEVDLIATADDRLVLKHDWGTPVQEGISDETIPDEETFLRTKLDGKYTPMSFGQFCNLMVQYPDLWVVTDTKYTQEEDVRREFQILTDTVLETGHPEILDRFIVQVYNEQMYEVLNQTYDFKTYLFTMYQRFYEDDTVGTFREVCRYCVNNGIEVMAIKQRRYMRYGEEIQQIADAYGIKLYVHTVNDHDAAWGMMEAGVTGIYTDEIYDEDL